MTEREPPPQPGFLRRSLTGPAQGPWRPPADVYRTRDRWLVKFELTGRAGHLRIVLPKPNEADLEKLPSHVRGSMEFVLVSSIEEALAAALAPDSGAEAET